MVITGPAVGVVGFHVFLMTGGKYGFTPFPMVLRMAHHCCLHTDQCISDSMNENLALRVGDVLMGMAW